MWIEIWFFFEIIYLCFYIYIICNIVNDFVVVFDDIVENEYIIKCVKDIVYYYDDLIELINDYYCYGEG